MMNPTPHCLTRVSKLTSFAASPHYIESVLAGPIPPEFGNLRALEYLHLERNQLGGEPQCTVVSAQPREADF